MEQKREHSGRYPLRDFSLLDHYMINLFSREENHDDVDGLIEELFKLMPDYGYHIENANRYLDMSAT